MVTTEFDELFKKFGELYNVSPELLKAQAIVESNLNPLAVSSHGAQGLAQIVPTTFVEWAVKLGIENPNPFDPAQSIQIQAAYMAWLNEQMNGNIQATLAAYNYGVGHMKRLAADSTDATIWLTHVPKETRDYIARILHTLALWMKS